MIKIEPLTSARFFAALFIVLYHGVPLLLNGKKSDNLLTRIVGFGYISVSFFFMLSGFILALVYLHPGRPIKLKVFFLSRFARIYPLYIAAITLDLPHFLYTQQRVAHAPLSQTVGTVLATFSLVQAWFPAFRGLDNPGWSLSVEAFFYLVFPFLGAIIIRLSLTTIFVLWIVVYVGGISLVHFLHASGQTYFPLPHLFVFVLGVMLARIYRWIGECPARVRSLEYGAPWIILAGVGVLLIIAVFRVPVPESLMQHGLAAPLFAFIILALANNSGLIARFLSTSRLVLLGEASFALYLIHQPLSAILRRPIESYGTPMFLLYLIFTVVLSVLSFRFLEVPARFWILARERLRTQESRVASSLMQ